MTHRTPFTPACRLIEMLAVATDTTVESTMIMKKPTRSAHSARQALRSESTSLNPLSSPLTTPPRAETSAALVRRRLRLGMLRADVG